MMTGHIIKADGHDSSKNLAVEEYLFDYVAQNPCFILYLWQNHKTVVIGRHQNAYTECNLDYAETNKIKVVRRKSGGGAVYHDIGNLNYTIITPRDFYAPDRSTKLIVTALWDLGIAAETNSRNDICLRPQGEKISGNAYRTKDTVGMHHGTLLFRTDLDEMENVLRVPSDKLIRRGIASVRSRVANVCDYYPSLTLSMIQEKIISEFRNEYQLNMIPLTIRPADILPYMEPYDKKEWNIGLFRDYDIRLHKQFAWGYMTIGVTMLGAFPNAICIETDALDVDDVTLLEKTINEEIVNESSNLLEIFRNNVFRYMKSRVIADDIVLLFNTAYRDGLIPRNWGDSECMT